MPPYGSYPGAPSAFKISFRACVISYRNLHDLISIFSGLSTALFWNIPLVLCMPPSWMLFLYLLDLVHTLAALAVTPSGLPPGCGASCSARFMSISFTLQARANWNFDMYFKSLCISVLICSTSCYLVNRRNNFLGDQ